jgi:hypothetical protein
VAARVHQDARDPGARTRTCRASSSAAWRRQWIPTDRPR